MKTVPITLHSKQQSFIEAVVKSGRFVTPSEVVETALQLLEGQEFIRYRTIADLKAEIGKGLDQLERGETVDFDLPDFLTQMHRQYRAKAA